MSKQPKKTLISRGAWKGPKNPTKFITDYFNGMNDSELADAHDTTADSVKKYLTKLRETEGLPARKDLATWKGGFELQHHRERQAFVTFLAKARTRKQIDEKFGSTLAEQFLGEEFDDFQIFKQLDDYNNTVYLLLPKFTEQIKVKKRDWQVHIPVADGGQGLSQPYCLINLPDEAFTRFKDEDEGLGRIDIAPLFDVHLGNIGHRHEKFLSYIRWIAETPNIYAICGGDLMENALDDGRGMTYETDRPPSTQLDQMCQLLAPIAHKILCAVPGNHEWRTYKHAGIDPMKVIADRLNIPYFDGPVYLSVVVGGHRFRIFVQHGSGNSQTKGGKMNSAGRPRRFTDFVHFLLSGHVHDPLVNSETCIVEDFANCRLTYPQQWTVVAPSFLRWEGTYAYRAAYAPPGSGGVCLHLYENGKYRATQK